MAETKVTTHNSSDLNSSDLSKAFVALAEAARATVDESLDADMTDLSYSVMTVQDFARDAASADDADGRAYYAHHVLIQAQNASLRLSQFEQAGKGAIPKQTKKLRAAVHGCPVLARCLLDRANAL